MRPAMAGEFAFSETVANLFIEPAESILGERGVSVCRSERESES